MAGRSYRELESWQTAMQLVELIYQFTAVWDDRERFGLTAQIRRAAVSVPSNIAEGYGRIHRRDYIRFLSTARGSVLEVQTQMQIAVRVNIAKRDALVSAWKLSQQLYRMLTAQMRSLAHSSLDGSLASPPPAPGPRPPAPQP